LDCEYDPERGAGGLLCRSGMDGDPESRKNADAARVYLRLPFCLMSFKREKKRHLRSAAGGSLSVPWGPAWLRAQDGLVPHCFV